MANYSKDSERQNKALKDLMSGKNYEKQYTQVGYEGKKENRGGETRKSELTDVMASVRMPWFCPKCDKAMKKRLDNKFWRIAGHCFNCQIEMENKMRISGEFENYQKSKMLENQKSYLKDLEQSIDDFEKTGGKQEWFNQVGAEILKNMQGFLAVSPDTAVQKIKQDVAKALSDLKKPDNVEKLEAIGGASAIVPSEGLVFKYKGNIYKFTGAFAPINQILGSLRF